MSDETTAPAPGAAPDPTAAPQAPAPEAAKPASPEAQQAARNPWADRKPTTAAKAPGEAPAPPAPKADNRAVLKAARDLKARDEELAKLRPLADEAKADREALASHAKAALDAAPENLRAAVLEIAGDNPRAQLRALTALQKAKLGGGAAPVAPAGANTAPAPDAKTHAAPSDPDVVAFQRYEALRQGSAREQLAARALAVTNGGAIERGRQKAGAASAKN